MLLALAIIGALVGVVGVIIGLLAYRAARIGAVPAYQYDWIPLVGIPRAELSEDEVTVLFNEVPVPRLTKTYVVFWNRGKKTLKGEDVVDSDRLRIELPPDAEIMKATIRKVTRAVNQFAVRVDPDAPNARICDFDYLDAGDGALIEILHTGTEGRPTFLGSIRGVPKGIRDVGRIDRTELSPPAPSFWLLRVGLMLVFAGVVGTFTSLYDIDVGSLSWFWNAGLALLGLVLGSLLCIGVWQSKPRFPSDLLKPDDQQAGSE